MNGCDWLREGIYSSDDLSAEEYHTGTMTKRPALSASIAKRLLANSPLHAWTAHPRLNPDWQPDDRGAFDIGSAAHVLLLEGDSFAGRIATVDAPSWQYKIAKDHREASREAGLIPMLEKDWQRTVDMVSAIHVQLPALEVDPPFFVDGKPEQTLIWDEDGVTCKARLDWLHNDRRTIDDLKTVPSRGGSAKPETWTRRTFWTIGADVEAAFHARGVYKLTRTWPAFRLLVAECRPPYAISALDLAPSAWELANKRAELAIRIWARCLERNEWPGYSRQVASIEPDSWNETDFLALAYAEEVAS